MFYVCESAVYAHHRAPCSLFCLLHSVRARRSRRRRRTSYIVDTTLYRQKLLRLRIFHSSSHFPFIHAISMECMRKQTRADFPFVEKNTKFKRNETKNHKIQSSLKVLRRKYEFYAYASANKQINKSKMRRYETNKKKKNDVD